jgi:hypothetical protein
VDREAKAAVERAVKQEPDVIYGYHTTLNNEVISTCNPQLRRESLNDSINSTNPDYSYINAAVEAQANLARSGKVKQAMEAERKQAELNAPRLKAEKAEEDKAASTYYACLKSHAKILALISKEPAEVIIHATFPSCSAERQATFDIIKRHTSYVDLDTMDAMDGVFKQNLLLEVIKARAQPAAPAEPTRTEHETPI